MSALVNLNDIPEYLRGAIGSNAGQENVGVDDLIIPRLSLVQSLSPVRDEQDPAYIDGIKEGDIYNALTSEFWRGSVDVVPVMYRREYQIWANRKLVGNSTAGFHGSYDSMDVARSELQNRVNAKPDLSGKLEILEVPVFFVLVVSGDGISEAVISFPRTKSKVARKWNSLIRLGGMSSYAKLYKLKSVVEKNDQGKFYNYGVDAGGFVTAEIFERAKDLHQQICDGKVKAQEEAEPERVTPNAATDIDSDDIPF